jgi:uncharacterized damage-inducible protein DinB
MPEKLYPSERILTLLSEHPAQIAAAAAGATPAQLTAPPSAGEWSAVEVLAHLRACADMWGGCILQILREDHPTLQAMNPRTWMKRTDYPRQAFAPSFEAYAAQRAELLAALRGLRPEDWQRGATVRVAGRPLERSVQFYADWLARHERPHVGQMERAVAAVIAGGKE